MVRPVIRPYPMRPEDYAGPTANLAAPSTLVHDHVPPPAPHDPRVPETGLTPEQWQDIEAMWRGTAMPAKEIAEVYGVRPRVLEDHAYRAGWTRDLKDQTRAQLERRSLEYDAAIAETLPSSPDEQIAYLAARTQHTVLMAHRTDIAELRTISRKIARKLHRHIQALEAYEENEDSNEARKNFVATRRILGERETVGELLEKLTRATERAVNMERVAWGIGAPGAGEEAPSAEGDVARVLSEMDPDDRKRLREVAASLVGSAEAAPR